MHLIKERPLVMAGLVSSTFWITLCYFYVIMNICKWYSIMRSEFLSTMTRAFNHTCGHLKQITTSRYDDRLLFNHCSHSNDEHLWTNLLETFVFFNISFFKAFLWTTVVDYCVLFFHRNILAKIPVGIFFKKCLLTFTGKQAFVRLYFFTWEIF